MLFNLVDLRNEEYGVGYDALRALNLPSAAALEQAIQFITDRISEGMHSSIFSLVNNLQPPSHSPLHRKMF